MTAEITKEVQEALQLEQQKADRFFFYLLLSHAPFAALIFPSGYDTWWVGISGAIVLLVITILGHFFLQKTVLLRHLYAITLLSYSILFIQVQMGRIEMHFHIFGALAFLLLYRDWKPIITGAGLIAIHHAVFNLCQQYDIAILEIPLKVFNYGTGWDIVTLHAFFVVFESSILVYFSYVFRAGFLRNQIQIRRLDALGEELNRIVQKSWDVSQYLSEDTAKLVSSSATLSGIASETAAAVSRRILSATQTEKNSIQEVIDTISHINSSAQRQARESDGLRILAEKNRQILDELQSVLQTLLESRQSKVQI
jgi:methyl-accepting chemotaxis protein